MEHVYTIAEYASAIILILAVLGIACYVIRETDRKLNRRQ